MVTWNGPPERVAFAIDLLISRSLVSPLVHYCWHICVSLFNGFFILALFSSFVIPLWQFSYTFNGCLFRLLITAPRLYCLFRLVVVILSVAGVSFIHSYETNLHWWPIWKPLKQARRNHRHPTKVTQYSTALPENCVVMPQVAEKVLVLGSASVLRNWLKTHKSNSPSPFACAQVQLW